MQRNSKQKNQNPRTKQRPYKTITTRERSVRDQTPEEPRAIQDDEDRSEGLNSFRGEINRLSHSNSAAAAKTKRYSVSKRSFDFDKNGNADKADAEKGGEEEEAERQIHQRRRRVASGAEETDSEQRRERKRRTPSREREDSKSYRSGSRERGSGSRRVSRSPERRSETTNPNNGIGSSVNSSNNNNIPAKFVLVPATDKEKRSSNNNADVSIKRVAVKRNVASPRYQSPARAARVINHS
ncbi:unnamed protein product [Brassica napus]|uniref:(rape) hypothetical protein n=1 Tax=Brassica napus TaxID=3708 RepID=A0A816TK97_BRANA|nr:unnamed protein product [Brassica napus]